MTMISILLLFSICLLTFFKHATGQCPAVRKCLSSEKCDLLPVPPASIGPRIRAIGYNVTQLRPGVYSYNDGAYMSVIVYKDSRLTLLDFPFAESSFRGDEYLLNRATMEILGGQRPKRLDMVYGHFHVDHIGGAPTFLNFIQDKFPGLKPFVWGTSETREFLGRNGGSRIPQVNVIVGDKGRTVDVAESLKIKLSVLGGHTNTDMVAHILPSSDGFGIAHMPDFVSPGFAPFQNFGFAVDFDRYVKAQETLLILDFKVFSPGHGRISDKRDIRRNLQYIRDAVKFSAEAVNEITPEMLAEAGVDRIEDENAVEFGNIQLSFKVNSELVSRICARKLIQKYGCKLGAVDIAAPSHCVTAFVLSFLDVNQV